MLRSRIAERGSCDGLQVLLGTVAQEEDLQMECPGVHLAVEIRKVGIVGDGLVAAAPAQSLADPFGERCLAGADIACHKDKMLCHGDSAG